MDNLIKARLRMVRDQIAGRGISNAALLEAMSKVQREFFVPPHLAEFAYLDTPLPIESGQTISQPYIVALMPLRLERAIGVIYRPESELMSHYFQACLPTTVR